jgi:heme A synthase
MLLLIASVILAAAVSQVAVAIGSEKDPDVGRLLLSAQILSWLVCAIAATFRIQDIRKVDSENTLTPEDASANERKFAIILWTVAAMVWMIVLLGIEGITEKGSV